MKYRSSVPSTDETKLPQLSGQGITARRYYHLLTIVFLTALCLGWSMRANAPILVDAVLPPFASPLSQSALPLPPSPPLCIDDCANTLRPLLLGHVQASNAGVREFTILLSNYHPRRGYVAILSFISANQIEYQLHYGDIRDNVWTPLMRPYSHFATLHPFRASVIRFFYPATVNGTGYSWDVGVFTDPILIDTASSIQTIYEGLNETYIATKSSRAFYTLLETQDVPVVVSTKIYDSNGHPRWVCEGEWCLNE